MTSQGVALEPAWRDWAGRRPEFRGTHLDCAAAGRASTAVLRAVSDHALLEAQIGAYQAEAQAAPVLDAGRALLAGLMGMPADGVAFVESATNALQALLTAWPLSEGATVAVTPGEWGPNLRALAARGLRLRVLATDEFGRVDLAALERDLAHDPPAIVHLTQVAAHRPLAQPVAAAARLCREAGVALWVDAAQALGHVDCANGADAVYATSRKWLSGPRGVAVLGVAERWWPALRFEPLHLHPPAQVVRRLESQDAHVAGRIGLCAAAREFLAIGPELVWRRLDEVGRLSRRMLADVPGWQVLAAPEGAGAITALRPTAGQDVSAVRSRLLAEHGILTTVCMPARAPREMTVALLRISPHVDCTPGVIDDVARALTSLTD